MATGDNVLTAISVARQCKILDPEKPVYLGEIVTNDQGLSSIQWKSSQVPMAEAKNTESNGMIQRIISHESLVSSV